MQLGRLPLYQLSYSRPRFVDFTLSKSAKPAFPPIALVAQRSNSV
jgi:hypothetical protein